MSENRTAAQREANLLSTVRLALAELRGADYPARRRGVMAVACMLGHRMGVEQLRDQPWGTVGECANCGQIAKAPRVGDTIEGRATVTFCPANRLGGLGVEEDAVDTMKHVREVRSQSGASLSVCKRVLVQVDGDVARAVEVLRKQGLGGVEGALAETRTEDEKGER